MKRSVKIFALMAVLIMGLAVATACGGGVVTDPDEVLAGLNVITAPSKTAYAEGEMFDPAGMSVEAVYKKGETQSKQKDVTQGVTYPTTPLTQADTSVTLTYTENSITVTAQVAVTVSTNAEKITIPTSNLTLDVPSGDAEAESFWYAVYGAESLEITAIVKDASIKTSSNLYNSDGVEFVLTTVKRENGLFDGSVKVIVTASGASEIKKAADGIYLDFEDSGITARASVFTLAGTVTEGYKIVVTVPFATIGGYGDKNIAACIGVTNANGAFVVTKYVTEFGTDATQSHTYLAIEDNNTFAENPYRQLGFVFGNAGALIAKPSWNVQNDIDGAGAAVIMTGLDADNELYMYRTDATNLYATIKFNAMSVHNNEKFGKFGITVTTQAGNGFLFYVDAAGNGANMTGTGLGVARKVGNSWTSFAGIPGSVGAAGDYQGANYIELSVYRQDSVFSLYCNGVKLTNLSGIVGIDAGTPATVGVAAFNIKLQLKDYSITDDPEDFEDKVITQEAKDYLFIGDSYVDTAFWGGYNTEFASFSAANMGVGGTKIPYWTDMADAVEMLYNPKNIVIHIGINDIDDSGVSALTATSTLRNLIQKYALAFPEAKIYYISLSPNNFKPEKWSICKEVNAAIASDAQSNAKLEFIDLAACIGTESGAGVAQYYGPDGLHFNADGYALWSREIKKALGIARSQSSTLGIGDTTRYATSAGFTVTDEKAANKGVAEQQAYINGIDDEISFFAQVDISVLGKTQPDNFPKIGLAMKSENKTVLFYIDAERFDNNWGNVVIRNTAKDWNWDAQRKQFVFLGDTSYNNSFKTLGVLKTGNAVYFMADNKVVYYDSELFLEDETVCLSVMLFNLDAEIKNVSAVTDATELAAKMAELNIGAQSEVSIDGSLAEWTAEQKSNPLVIPATDGRSVSVYAYKAEDGVYIAYDVLHSVYISDKNEWFNNTNLEFMLGEAGQRAASVDGFQTVFTKEGNRAIGKIKFTDAVENGLHHTVAEIFVPYCFIEGYDASSAFIPAGFAFKTPSEMGNVWAAGDFWYVPEAAPADLNLMITSKGFLSGADVTVDGSSADWDADILAANKVYTQDAEAEGSKKTVTLSAFMGTDGVYVFITVADIKEIDVTTGANDWFANPNLELKFGPDKNHSKVIVYKGAVSHTGLVADAAFAISDDKMTLSFEVFVPYERISKVDVLSASCDMQLGMVVNGWYGAIWDANVVSVTAAGLAA